MPDLEVKVVSLAAHPSSATVARRHVHDFCERLELDASEEAEIVVTELVANGVNHAQTPVTLKLARVDGGVRIEVSDDSPRHPVMRAAAPYADGGRGLWLVDALASRWGVDAHPTGKRVWAEVCAG